VYILLSEEDWKIKYIPSSGSTCRWLLAFRGLRAPAADFAGGLAAVFTALERAPALFAPVLELAVRRFAVTARFDFERSVLVAIASLPVSADEIYHIPSRVATRYCTYHNVQGVALVYGISRPARRSPASK
jgi:hypothetical protein